MRHDHLINSQLITKIKFKKRWKGTKNNDLNTNSRINKINSDKDKIISQLGIKAKHKSYKQRTILIESQDE